MATCNLATSSGSSHGFHLLKACSSLARLFALAGHSRALQVMGQQQEFE